MKIATCNYVIENLTSWDQYENKILNLVKEAKQNQADLLLLPEYAGVESNCQHYKTDLEVFSASNQSLERYLDFFKKTAVENAIYIQAGTTLVKKDEKTFFNRAYFFSPKGTVGFQDKLQLTEYEKSSGVIAQGESQTIFETPFGKIGIAICYDSEFPEIVRCLVFAGCDLILVPSYTSTTAGYFRVFLSARARALENQCFVAAAFIVGTVATGDGTDQTTGQACILGPVDVGFPDNGIIAQADNAPLMVCADLSFKKLQLVRQKGQVHNFEDSKHFKGLGAPACLPF